MVNYGLLKENLMTRNEWLTVVFSWLLKESLGHFQKIL